ncbi:hypothetical protein HYS28_01785 [Candidatus Uhrbacteria bacterium]|nr:hypothetical protein [Candidatus Uhrbacteria bacterium]
MTIEEVIAGVNASDISEEEKAAWRWSLLMQPNVTMIKLGLEYEAADTFNPAVYSEQILQSKSW